MYNHNACNELDGFDRAYNNFPIITDLLHTRGL
jgi:hypothetical protein